jgi:hypothetical protein
MIDDGEALRIERSAIKHHDGAEPPRGLIIPRFVQPAPRPQTTPPRLVAAIRYDYEIGLMSQIDVVRRYSTVLDAGTVRDICAGRIHPDVKASRFKLNWR